MQPECFVIFILPFGLDCTSCHGVLEDQALGLLKKEFQGRQRAGSYLDTAAACPGGQFCGGHTPPCPLGDSNLIVCIAMLDLSNQRRTLLFRLLQRRVRACIIIAPMKADAFFAQPVIPAPMRCIRRIIRMETCSTCFNPCSTRKIDFPWQPMKIASSATP